MTVECRVVILVQRQSVSLELAWPPIHQVMMKIAVFSWLAQIMNQRKAIEVFVVPFHPNWQQVPLVLVTNLCLMQLTVSACPDDWVGYVVVLVEVARSSHQSLQHCILEWVRTHK